MVKLSLCNVAFALSILFVEIYVLVFKETRGFSLEVVVFLACIIYLLLKIPFVRRPIQPTIEVHVMFGCSYAITVLALCFAEIAIAADANAIGVVMLLSPVFVFANILLVVGVLILLVRAIHSVFWLKSNDRMGD